MKNQAIKQESEPTYNFPDYTLEVFHVHDFNIRRVTGISGKYSECFTGMIGKFLKKSHERNLSVDTTLRQILFLLGTKNENAALFLIEKDDQLYGYFYAEISVNKYGQPCCFIHQVYIDAALNEFNMLREVDKMLVNWAKSRNVDQLIFLTSRTPLAMKNKLSSEWIIDSVVFKRYV